MLGGPVGYGLGSLVPNNAPVYSGRDDYSTRSPELIRQQIQAQQTLRAEEQRKLEAAKVAAIAEQNRVAAAEKAYASAMSNAGISYDSNAYGGGGGFTNSEGNAPGASYGEVGNASFSGDVGYDQ